jgi:NAD(P)H-nitrite reductase large subunit
MDYIIIGSGIAGMTAAKTIREHDQNGTITVYTYEFHPIGCYARKDLTRRLMTELVEPDDLLLDSPKSLADLNIRVEYEDISAVVPQMRHIMYPHYVRKTYDRLLIATGSIPRLVDAPGVHYIGVHQLWNYEDASLIEAWLPELQRSGAVVVGGGILGMDAAYMLASRGVQTTLVSRENRLGSPGLSESEGLLAVDRLREVGVEVILGDTLHAYLSHDDLVLDGVRLNSGRIIKARMALCTVGVHPSTDFLAESEIQLDGKTHAVQVNAKMQTSYPDVYAAGSCAIVDGYIARNWNQSAEQGRVAGLNMVSEKAVYQPLLIDDPVIPLVLETAVQPLKICPT